MTRFLMSFRADEIAVGDFIHTEHGPAEVIEKAHVVVPEQGRVIEIHATTEQEANGDEPASKPVHTFHIAPHELVSLWELRP